MYFDGWRNCIEIVTDVKNVSNKMQFNNGSSSLRDITNNLINYLNNKNSMNKNLQNC